MSNFIGTVVKQIYEEFPIKAGFTKWLVTGETINPGPAVTARNADTSSDTTATVCLGAPIVAGTTVIQQVKNGTAGQRHIVTFRIVTSLGNKYETEIQLTVR